MKEFINKLIGRLAETKRIVYEYEHSSQYEPKKTEVIDYEDAIEIVKELAEEYKGGWIPVTERLPRYDVTSEYYEEVIVTLDDGRVTSGCYRNLDEEWWVNTKSGTKHAINATGHVIAWQPLPAPSAPFRTEKVEWKDKVMKHFTKVE